MKKIIIGVLGLIVAVAGFDLDGRIGMGLGFSPDAYVQSSMLGLALPVIDIAVTRIGMNPKLSFEPIFQFTMTSTDVPDATRTYFALSGLANFLMKGHQKTNIYTKAGLGFFLDSPGGGADSEFGLTIPFGFGLEHFVSEHFSINLAALSGLTFVSNHPTYDQLINVKLGNEKPFAFYLLWYY